MKKQNLFLSALAVFFSGCLVSLYPLFNDDELISDSSYEGTWQSESLYWKITRNENKTYSILDYDKGNDTLGLSGDSALFIARLGKIKNRMFMDLFPDKESLRNKNVLFAMHFLPAHTFWKTEISNDTLRVSMMDGDAVSKMIEEKKISVQHKIVNEQLIITASGKALKEFVSALTDNAKAFGETTVFVRKK